MSELVDAIKDAVNPKRREQATVETYDPHTRGPYPDRPPAGDNNQVHPSSRSQQPETEAGAPQRGEAQDAGRVEQGDLSGITTAAAAGDSHEAQSAEQAPKLASGANYNAPQGTYGPHKSRVANTLDPRVDSDRDGIPSHGISDYGGAAAKPLHAEGSKYGLS
ncbi:hypothetical protein VTH82DRAFT_3976 [Thermothelomyces myriococcoides]